MSSSLEEFHHEFFQDLHGSADADGRYVEDTFFERFCSHLVEAGELETADRAQYLSPRGIRIDGYGGDPATCDGVLSLIIADYYPEQKVSTLTATEMNAIFNRATNFVSKSLDARFRERLEETSAAFGLADMIAVRWSQTNKVRILLISNRVLSERVDGRDAGKVENVAVTYGVWDLGRLHRFSTSGHGREDIEIDLEGDFGGSLPVLSAHLDGASYQAYLAVIPGQQLAAIYDRWGARLLEQNVRVFLQARGNVNKGIRITLENSPEMFFAYNNGITATAESVTTRQTKDGLTIRTLKNLQIVNGGQTTASIHAAGRMKENHLSRVFVQMKLSIVDPATAMDVVPKISEYANTQNRVNAADFFANHPFHVRIETFSRRMFSPSPDGTFRESKWFYERARGQYQDARAHLTVAQRRKFDMEYPKSQMFTKTDLAKFLMLWQGKPDIVSKGAQKNFAEFAHYIAQEWANTPDSFNELYYQHAIAKAITFRAVETLVSNQSWYEGGYRAQIVAYAIAKLAHDAEINHRTVDFNLIWRQQSLSDPLKKLLLKASQVAHDALTTPPPGSRNVTEWAKQKACWQRLKDERVDWPNGWLRQMLPIYKLEQAELSAVKDQRILNGIEAQTAVLKAGAKFWKDVLTWGETRKLLTPLELGVLDVASNLPAKLPSDKQSAIALAALAKLQVEGCHLKLLS